MLTITFAGAWPADLQTAVERVFAALLSREPANLPEGTINLKLVDDHEITRLNASSTGNNEPTDVLTFNYQEDATEPPDGELADIVISTETAGRQAAAANIDPQDEVALLALHGILHAMGHDHATTEDQADLDQLQADVMGDAGLPYRDFKWKP